ncbi:hypothetical protein HDU76_004675 [Blyttiomyces sp. JEL0837]|nr:hypothetical protein HDU76_004675 [Blyttiomyces sp. JEL0837]
MDIYTAAIKSIVMAMKGLNGKIEEALDGNKKDKYPPNTVILHIFDRPNRPLGTPCFSAYSLKMETYLRVTSTPYIIETKTGFSKSKGKKPYITYNGLEVSDSEVIIKWLEKNAMVERYPNQLLDECEKGAACAYRCMIDQLNDIL